MSLPAQQDAALGRLAAQPPSQAGVRSDGLRAALAWRDKRYGEVLAQLGG